MIAHEGLDDALDDALARFAARPEVLVALDFDGVLAPLVLDPSTSRVLPRSAAALDGLAADDGVQLALVSGRELGWLRELADPPPGTLLVGSHGAQVEGPDGRDVGPATALDDDQRRALDEVSRALGTLAGDHDGVYLETKPAGVVLHTRRAAADVAEDATRAATDVLGRHPDVHVTLGKQVVEASVLQVTKGTALTDLKARLGVPVLYVGDDVTDERAFAVLDDDAGDVTVHVGSGRTAARHRVPDPDAVSALLERLAELRGRRPAG